MFAAVRVVGKPDSDKGIEDSLKLLGLDKRNKVVFLPEKSEFKGMLEKVKDSVAYGEVDKSFVEDFCSDKGCELDGKTVLSSKPPSKGYRNIKEQFNQGGSLGNRGEEIKGLLIRMG